VIPGIVCNASRRVSKFCLRSVWSLMTVTVCGVSRTGATVLGDSSSKSCLCALTTMARLSSVVALASASASRFGMGRSRDEKTDAGQCEKCRLCGASIEHFY
jgi:hypothetical protein